MLGLALQLFNILFNILFQWIGDVGELGRLRAAPGETLLGSWGRWFGISMRCCFPITITTMCLSLLQH